MKFSANARRERIIETVVSLFMRTGTPVNSAIVSRESGLELKASSIRAIMKELEEDGYLLKPHTSAGRVPTLKSYRYYVSNLMPKIALPETDIALVRDAVERSLREHDTRLFLHHMATVISELTDLVGVALSPDFERGIFDKLDIVDIGGSSVLLVMTLASGTLNTIRITLDSIIPRTRLEETARVISSRLHGLSIAEIRATLTSRLRDVSSGDRTLVEVIVRSQDRIFSTQNDNTVHVSGLSRVLTLPEFHEYDHSMKLITMMEEPKEIEFALRQAVHGENGVSIMIGGSGLWGPAPALSLISAQYHSDFSEGAIGIIGPARVDYPRLSALVSYAAGYASQFFSA